MPCCILWLCYLLLVVFFHIGGILFQGIQILLLVPFGSLYNVYSPGPLGLLFLLPTLPYSLLYCFPFLFPPEFHSIQPRLVAISFLCQLLVLYHLHILVLGLIVQLPTFILPVRALHILCISSKYWWGGHWCPMHCDLFEIYCAPPNLGITRTWICRLKFAQNPISSDLRFFNEPEFSD